MAFVRPTGHEDPGEDWIHPDLAYDGDVITFAFPVTWDEGLASLPLVLTLPPTRCNEVRFFIMTSEPGSRFTISVLNEDESAHSGWQDAPPGMDWYSFAFEPQHVQRVYIRLMPITPGETKPGVGECVLVTACGGPLEDFCNILCGIRDFFSSLADAIIDVMFVGDSLSAPFTSLSNTFGDLGDKCCDFSLWLEGVIEELQAGVTWDAIEALLEEYAPSLYALLTDPVPYITNIVSDLIPELPSWLADPVAWLDGALQEHAPVLYYLWHDPTGEVLYLVGQAFELEPYQAETPEMIVKTLFERYFPELYLIWRDPDAWLRERVLALLEEFAADVAGFLEDAWAWLLDRYEDAFEAISDRLYGLAEHTLRFFWEGEW